MPRSLLIFAQIQRSEARFSSGAIERLLAEPAVGMHAHARLPAAIHALERLRAAVRQRVHDASPRRPDPRLLRATASMSSSHARAKTTCKDEFERLCNDGLRETIVGSHGVHEAAVVLRVGRERLEDLVRHGLGDFRAGGPGRRPLDVRHGADGVGEVGGGACCNNSILKKYLTDTL